MVQSSKTLKNFTLPQTDKNAQRYEERGVYKANKKESILTEFFMFGFTFDIPISKPLQCMKCKRSFSWS